MAGRLLCDTFAAAKEYLKSAKSQELGTLAAECFGVSLCDDAGYVDENSIEWNLNNLALRLHTALRIVDKLALFALFTELSTATGTTWYGYSFFYL